MASADEFAAPAAPVKVQTQPPPPSGKGSGHAAHAKEPRVAHINGQPPPHSPDNTITTSKYTALSFVPRSLFEQFRRIANVYFLFISVLMLIGTYLPKIFESPLTPYSTLGPLIIVLAITMAKEGAEDLKRHRSDKEVNNRTIPVVEADGTEKQVLWKDLRVGQVIRVVNKGEVPADMIVLQSSENKSACYIETSQIDGEVNLKLKEAVAQAASRIPVDKAGAAGSLHGYLTYDPPNGSLYTFTGALRLDGAGEQYPVGPRNVILRGCNLRNTHWVLGLVVYTGRETKVMMKAGGGASKMSQVERTMNTCIKIVFAAQVVLCTVTTIAEALWNAANTGELVYLRSAASELWIPTWLGNWFTYLLLFNNFIPISLYVTVEMVNYLQAGLINTDGAMYDPESDTPARARTSNLNQDLGQIEYVLSDKTGTLTRNVMEFRQCSIAGRVFGTHVPEAATDEEARLQDASCRSGDAETGGVRKAINPAASGQLPVMENPARRRTDSQTPPSPRTPDVAGAAAALPASPAVASGFKDPGSFALLRFGDVAPGYGADWLPYGVAAGSPNAGRRIPVRLPEGRVEMYTGDELVALEAFWTCMAVCHTVVPEKDEKGGPPIYQAESPDEAALTKAARELGFEFVERHAEHIVVRRRTGRGDADLSFSILGVHEFNSTRKRMAVVARTPAGKYLLMVKGADNVMFDRSIVPAAFRARLDGHLTRFAETGLRTLVLGQREMSEQEVVAWRADFHAASVALKGREEKLAAVAEKYEVGLTVLGATAIEDRLQEGVPAAIRDLRRAGIKTWVLTGDKVETAINIGFSCRLLDPTMELIQILAEDPAELRHQLTELEARFKALPEDAGRGGAEGAGICGAIARLFGCKKRPSTGPLTKVAGGGAKSLQLRNIATGVPGHEHHHHHVPGSYGLVVTGPALTHILHVPEMARALLTVATRCKSVVACRVSPAQKAEVVLLVRTGVKPRPLTLAIGDGANDVNMIQAAQVGVGISGKEGLQAANAADFSISQFRFLKRLLLVHGRWDYRRMTKVVLYSFYKNVVITLSLFFFNALTGFSGTSFYESLVYSSYNFVLGLPIVVIGVLDRDISESAALEHPIVYATGRNYDDLNVKRMLSWIGTAIAHSLLLFWLPYGAYCLSDAVWDGTGGQVDGMAVAGFTTFSALVWGMTLTVSQQTLTWTWVNWLLVGLSLLGWYVFCAAYASGTFSPDFSGVLTTALSRPNYWLVIVLCLGAQLIFDLLVGLVQNQLFPRAVDIARELDHGHGRQDSDGRLRWGDELTEEEKAAVVAPNTVSPTPKEEEGGSTADIAPVLSKSSKNWQGGATGVGEGALAAASVSGERASRPSMSTAADTAPALDTRRPSPAAAVAAALATSSSVAVDVMGSINGGSDAGSRAAGFGAAGEQSRAPPHPFGGAVSSESGVPVPSAHA